MKWDFISLTNPLPIEIWDLTSAWSGLEGAGKPRPLKILADYRAGPFGQQEIDSMDHCSPFFPLSHVTSAWDKSHGEEKHGGWSQRKPAVSLVLLLASCVTVSITYILCTSISLSIAWSTVMSSFRSPSWIVWAVLDPGHATGPWVMSHWLKTVSASESSTPSSPRTHPTCQVLWLSARTWVFPWDSLAWPDAYLVFARPLLGEVGPDSYMALCLQPPPLDLGLPETQIPSSPSRPTYWQLHAWSPCSKAGSEPRLLSVFPWRL